MRSVRYMIVVAGTALALGFGIGVVAAPNDQGHMRQALRSLEMAKTQLERAVPDKGGHRVKAIQLVNDAMNEVQEGIKVGEQSEKK